MSNSKVINIRIAKHEKDGLVKAAKMRGVSLSAFLRWAAFQEAHRVLGPPKLVKK